MKQHENLCKDLSWPQVSKKGTAALNTKGNLRNKVVFSQYKTVGFHSIQRGSTHLMIFHIKWKTDLS